MKKNPYVLNTVLAVVLFVTLLAALLVRVFLPAGVIPPLNIPNMVLLSVLALLVEYWLAGVNPRCYLCIFLLSALSFALLPLVAGFACWHTFWKIGLTGGVVFTLTSFLFTSATDRMMTGPKAKAAAVITALGIWLASQCFTGVIL